MFDPLWLLTRQWQIGEFQAEDAGTPVQARVRATNGDALPALLRRAAQPTTPAPAPVAAQRLRSAADAARGAGRAAPHARRPTPNDARMLTFAVEAGLHFLRMLELAAAVEELSIAPSSPGSRCSRWQPPARALIDEATSRFVQTMVGRAPDGRQLAALLRTVGAAQLVARSGTEHRRRRSAEGQADGHRAGSPGTTRCSASPAGPPTMRGIRRAWSTRCRSPRRLSANRRRRDDALGERDRRPARLEHLRPQPRRRSLTHRRRPGLQRRSSKTTVPAPVTFPGAPAPRFWEMEDARIDYGLVPVGPTDLAQLLMIEYASSYGNDWFVVPLTLPVGSVTRVDSLVVTDTFGVRSLLRPIGDPALPAGELLACGSPRCRTAPAQRGAEGRRRTCSSCRRRSARTHRQRAARGRAVHARRDGQPRLGDRAQRREPDRAAGAALRSARRGARRSGRSIRRSRTCRATCCRRRCRRTGFRCCRCRCRIPRSRTRAGQILSRLKRGAVLQPDGSQQGSHRDRRRAAGRSATSCSTTRKCRARARGSRVSGAWRAGPTARRGCGRRSGSRSGRARGRAQLKFDQVLEPGGDTR